MSATRGLKKILRLSTHLFAAAAGIHTEHTEYALGRRGCLTAICVRLVPFGYHHRPLPRHLALPLWGWPDGRRRETRKCGWDTLDTPHRPYLRVFFFFSRALSLR
ncbi:Protein of unknown function [Pyronema omphalodes CBS 100304]|uniref:Uncharacterized protein n=1 Tax=Pyronema omphalodes (strain CBS 100304) TaxID=1076935 RepID=U4LBC2_PYROM|nr:Protein of unknown function [Pyronema omphalodes CBS 100304]